MTAPLPGPGPQQVAAASPAPGRRPSSRRGLALVAGLVAFLLAGTGAFVLARNHRAAQVTVSCDDDYGCVPGLKAMSALGSLRDQGYTCTTESDDWHCELTIGTTYFDVWFRVYDELIHKMSIRVNRAGDDTMATTGVAYLSWFATIPYRDDPATSKDIRDWLAEQIAKHKETKAKILDYEYVLQNPDSKSTKFTIEAVS
ncbi:hypothetical protein [Microbispora sp. GKU 823]|uniref:hypothetical protein n=1 Tax=Microbispora sp. GKU 823 TaxID=1652100 RepID=UPI0009A41F5C|nr:hypothetical protein [Microbispora sp. GKU 823]OPG13301.1 hypothetical protein B1L11_08565 [Microbispora sp. GKU 823]